MATFNLEVLTPEKTFFIGEANSLVVTLKDGDFGILANHENMFGAIVPGLVKIEDKDGNIIYGASSKGFVKVIDNNVYLMLDTIENPDEIDEARAREALEKAEEELRYQERRREYYIQEAKLHRAMNRLKVKNKYKRR